MSPRSIFHALAALVVLTVGSSSTLAHPLEGQADLTPLATNKNVIIQMFEWNWASIASECTNFIGPAGYGYVQVSPPQETIQGSQWWTDYQPVSYTLTGKRGNRSQFSSMVTACHNAGVKVLVDAVWNHMTSGDGTGTGTAGDSYTKYSYPGTYSTSDFHYCTQESDHQIHNYNNAQEVWTCELSDLADLATDTSYVQSRLTQYGNDLISLGVDGFRLDAAKHMDPSNIAAILKGLSKSVYISQEVIYGSGEAVQPSQYTGNGQVQEFRYTNFLYQTFSGNSGGISQLQNLDSKGWITGSSANVFVTNHDTERGSSTTSLNYNSPSNEYTNAMIFSLAHPYGTPTILSSYTISSFDGGAPNNNMGTCSGSGGSNGWLCQHRWTAVAGMVGFRNNAGSATLTNWVSPSSNQIAFGRGSTGFVAINNADSSWSTTFSTSLVAGTYCNVISGAASSGSCTSGSFTVSSSGTFSATVPARSSIAIHTGQKVSGGGGSTSTSTTTTTSTSTTSTSSPTGSSVQVTFAPTVTTVYGENVFVVGSISQLGSWAAGSAIALSSSSYPVWKATVSVPAGTTFQYKYIKKESNGTVVWESDPNRQDTTPSSGSQTLNDSWR